MEIKFTIQGNQDDPAGNPVPYVRSTRGALWRKDGRRYREWKEFVVAKFLDSNPPKRIPPYSLSIVNYKKPISLRENEKATMNIEIFWKNRAHGDPDNIWKGIADALFVNDKNVDGSFESRLAPDGRGRVEVKINIGDRGID